MRMIHTCPMNILPAAFTDSAGDVPMVTCRSHATFMMTNCIQPR